MSPVTSRVHLPMNHEQKAMNHIWFAIVFDFLDTGSLSDNR